MNTLIWSLLCTLTGPVAANWEAWWTYEGISGPNYWGLINPDWTMCNKGKRQSPINLDPAVLHHDPQLTAVHVDKQSVSGRITNTGQTLVFRLEEGQLAINITGGPLAYKYQFEEFYLHWGEPGLPGGSEHTVDNKQFPAEIQIYGYNADLFSNLTSARESPGGVVAIAVLVQITQSPYRKSSFGFISGHLDKLTYREESMRMPKFSLASILPDTDLYITYEGSTTFPGCWETATWIVFNKPIYITDLELDQLYSLRQSEKGIEKGAPLGNNLRPRQEVNGRVLRTNLGIPAQQEEASECQDGLDSIEYIPNNWISFSHLRPYSP